MKEGGCKEKKDDLLIEAQAQAFSALVTFGKSHAEEILNKKLKEIEYAKTTFKKGSNQLRN